MKSALFLLALIATSSCTSATVRAEEKQDSSGKIPLPGLAISLGMSVDEVAIQLQQIKFRHIPEKRWQKNGNAFVQREQLICSAVSLDSLNEQLEEARFVFEEHILVEVELTILRLHKALDPLIEKLKLVEAKPEVYVGLDGKIVMRGGRSNAEKTTWVIGRPE